MADTALGDTPAHTSGDLPEVGAKAPAFTLVADDLSTSPSTTWQAGRC